jgi:hypothetical protein
MSERKTSLTPDEKLRVAAAKSMYPDILDEAIALILGVAIRDGDDDPLGILGFTNDLMTRLTVTEVAR